MAFDRNALKAKGRRTGTESRALGPGLRDSGRLISLACTGGRRRRCLAALGTPWLFLGKGRVRMFHGNRALRKDGSRPAEASYSTSRPFGLGVLLGRHANRGEC
jgi:hypothetical protein